ncbi:MAG: GNAT family N-acetyltransferase, partial [Synechococcales bacterium]|nr:GNAT family N-acetyltransferase [Synechococcales bacterium]
VTQMPDLIAEADLAIAAGGSTNWELAFLGLPSIIITLADNQTAIADMLQEKGISRSLGWHQRLQPAQIALTVYQLCHNAEKRSTMSQKGQALVDGAGCDRVVMQLTGRAIRLRKAQLQDCRLVWQWANEPSTRQASFQTQPIAWEPHVQWFEEKLQDPTCDFWIAIDAHEIPVGQVRCDRLSSPNSPAQVQLSQLHVSQTVQISISVDSNFRHRGYGRQIVEMAVQKILSQPSIQSISAWIKPNNFASIHLFEQAHFVKVGTEWRDGQPALHYQLWRTMIHA